MNSDNYIKDGLIIAQNEVIEILVTYFTLEKVQIKKNNLEMNVNL